MTAPTAADVLALLTPETLAALTPEERAMVDGFLPVVVEQKPDISDPDHPAQQAMILDDHRFIATLCNRRSGKTYGACLKQCNDANKRPGSVHLFLGITLASAKRNCWEACFKDIDIRFDLKLKFNEVNSTIRFPNGAIIYVVGADASDSQRKKMRGGKYRSIIVDEAQDFSTDLDDLVKSILRPAVMDQLGWILLQGTPGQMPIGLFYRITKDASAENPGEWDTIDVATETEWHGHTWSSAQNYRVADQLAQELASMVAINPRVRDTPTFQREWLGRWVTDMERRVYRYTPGLNDYTELPPLRRDGWNYAIGVDLGFNDETTLCCIAWHDNDHCAYVVESDGMDKMDITDAVEWLRSWMLRYPTSMVVIDGANKQAVEEMRRRHGLPLIAADKREKADFIGILNDAFVTGQLKIRKGTFDEPQCEGLRTQMAHLSWDEKWFKRKIFKEDPKAPNDLCDSLLYAYRLAYAYLAEEMEAKIRPNTPEWFAREERLMQERAIASLDEQEDDLKWLT